MSSTDKGRTVIPWPVRVGASIKVRVSTVEVAARCCTRNQLKSVRSLALRSIARAAPSVGTIPGQRQRDRETSDGYTCRWPDDAQECSG